MLFRDLAMLGDAACAIELTWPLSSRDAPGALSEPIRPKSFLQLPLGALGQLSAQDVYGQLLNRLGRQKSHVKIVRID
jgi:hypothetical protein